MEVDDYTRFEVLRAVRMLMLVFYPDNWAVYSSNMLVSTKSLLVYVD